MEIFKFLVVTSALFPIACSWNISLTHNSTVNRSHPRYVDYPEIKPELAINIDIGTTGWFSKLRIELRSLGVMADHAGINQDSDQFLNQQYDKMRQKIEEILDVLEKGKKDADGQGVDISSCIQSSVEGLKGVPKDSVDVIKVCVQFRLRKVEKILSEKSAAIKVMLEKIDKMIQDVEGCEKSSNKETCLDKLSQEVEKARVEMTKKGQQIKAEIQEVMLNFKTAYLPECVEDELSAVALMGEIMIDRVMSCVKTKYPNINVKFGEGSSSSSFPTPFLLIIILTSFVNHLVFTFFNK